MGEWEGGGGGEGGEGGGSDESTHLIVMVEVNG